VESAPGFLPCAKVLKPFHTIMEIPVEGARLKLTGEAAKLKIEMKERCSDGLTQTDWKCRICKDENESVKQSRAWIGTYYFDQLNELDVMPFGPGEKIKIAKPADGDSEEVLFRLRTPPRGKESMTFTLACSMTGRATQEELVRKDAPGLCGALKEKGISLQLRPQPEDLLGAPTNDNKGDGHKKTGKPAPR